MKRDTAKLLCCPLTGSPLAVERVDEEHDGEILDGALAAERGGHVYAVTGGVPDLTSPVSDSDKAQSIASFGREWEAFRSWGWMEEMPEGETEEVRYVGGFLSDSAKAFRAKTRCRDSDIAEGNLVLDMGCGNGRFCYQAQSLGAKVIGLDASEAAYVAFRNLRERGVKSVDIVRGNALNLPFATGTFDYAFSIGVMQHTGDAPTFLSELTRVVRKEGAFSVNCYGSGLPTYEFVDRTLRAVTTRLDPGMQMSLSRGLAGFCRFLRARGTLGLHLERLLYRHMMILPTVHHMFDWYSPRLAEHFSPLQLKAWLAERGAVVEDAAPPFHVEGYDDRSRRRGHASFQFRAVNERADESAAA